MSSRLFVWDPRFILPFLWASLIIFQGLTASLINRCSSIVQLVLYNAHFVLNIRYCTVGVVHSVLNIRYCTVGVVHSELNIRYYAPDIVK